MLLDEVEKAAPEVFDIFLQVFDEGRLTDSQGATIDGRHAAWIMTSNIGTGDVGKGLGFTATPDQLPDYDFHLKKHFRPEFLNRLDEVVVFKPLTEAALDEILNLQMQDVTERLTTQKLTIELEPDARELLLREGYDPAYGARPLRRAIQRYVENPLALQLLSGELEAGALVADLQEDRIQFFPAPEAPPELAPQAPEAGETRPLEATEPGDGSSEPPLPEPEPRDGESEDAAVVDDESVDDVILKEV